MGLVRALRELDRRLLPPVADRLFPAGRHRRRRPLGGGSVLLAAVALLTATLWWVQHPAAPPPPHTVARVGIADGESLPGYVSAARQRLDRLAAAPKAHRHVYALVSLTGYLSPSRLSALMAGVRPHRVYSRVPSAGLAVQVAAIPVRRIPADVNTGMDRLARDRQRIAADFGRLAGSTTEPVDPGHDQYRVEQHGYQIEASAYRRHCSCVFAAVVWASPAALSTVSRRHSVRVVDPASNLTSLSGATFTAPLPEQTGSAGDAAAAGPAESTTPASTPSGTDAPVLPAPDPSGSAGGPARPASPDPSGSAGGPDPARPASPGPEPSGSASPSTVSTAPDPSASAPADVPRPEGSTPIDDPKSANVASRRNGGG